MIYGSVCSGIEAATVAWHPLGWQAAFYAEIEKFPSAVLAHHYPNTPNLGDITKFRDWQIPPKSIDLLVGGTPCQSFSVAGLRKGMADPRGNLALVFLGIADRLRPRWLVWENVPGVLSSNEGRDFGSFLGALVKLGYGFAYRICDAQYFGVPQRRRRVFVIGYLGDWRRAAAVLFESHDMSGNFAPSREARKDIASATGGGIVGSLCAADYKGVGSQNFNEGKVIAHSLRGDGFDGSSVAPCLTQNYGKQPDNSDTNAGPMLIPIVPAIVANGDAHSGYRDEHGLVPIAFNWQDNHAFQASSESTNPLRRNQTEAIAIQGGGKTLKALKALKALVLSMIVHSR